MYNSAVKIFIPAIVVFAYFYVANTNKKKEGI
jgi:hypothetical protein